MADIKTDCPTNSTSFKEAVCIDAGRVYDSCCDRDCLEDLRCYFLPPDQQIVSSAISVRVRKAEVIDVSIDVEPVTFDRGFYSCDLTFFFMVELDAYTSPRSCPKVVRGVAFFHKKAILFGSEGSVKTFSNEFVFGDDCDHPSVTSNNMPKCVVQCVDPIALSARICEIRDCFDCPAVIPHTVCNCIGGNIDTNIPNGTPTVYVTLGLFTIIQLIRNVQMLIPVYDFCIPEKQCDDQASQPCDVFRRIKFPNDDFFPPRPCDVGGCGCSYHDCEDDC